MTRLRALRLIAAVVCAAMPEAATASEFKTVRDWLAACDNLRNCSAYGTEAEGGSGRAYLRVERAGAANAPVRITISVDLENAVTFRLAFDDPALPGLPKGTLTGNEGEGNDLRRVVLAEGAAVDTLIASFRKAKALIVSRQPAPGKTLDEPVTNISMSGAVAALLWIDDQQKRIDTTTALIRRGNKPASAIPPQPQAPVVVAAAPGKSAVPTQHPKALIAKGVASCRDGDLVTTKDDGTVLDEVLPLGANELLYAFHCRASSGAYNMHYSYLVAPAGKPEAARQLRLSRPTGIGNGDETLLINPQFDAATNTLTTYSKGRGIGDCGTEEQWVYDGKAFRLVEMKSMPECKGIPADDWPVLYRATVKR